MGTASSVHIPETQGPLTYPEAIKSTGLTNHEEAISNIVGSMDPDVVDTIKECLSDLMRNNRESGSVTSSGVAGSSVARLSELVHAHPGLQAVLSKTDVEFQNLIQTLFNSSGEKAETVTEAEVIGILSAPRLPARRKSVVDTIQIVVDVEDISEEGTEHVNDGKGLLTSAASNYNESTRLINYVMDTNSPDSLPTARHYQRSRKASLSIGIDLDGLKEASEGSLGHGSNSSISGST